MTRMKLLGAVATWALFLWTSASQAQSGNPDVYWHINPSVRTCSMVIDRSLTQDQWHSFTRQVGALSSFKPLASAKTLGRTNLYVAIDYASTPVNQHDPAWINTFVHPDANCPLGDAIAVPTVRARLGVSDHMDVGGFWTTAPGANYGLLGGEVKYAFLPESKGSPAAAIRASVTTLTGVPDFNMNIFSIDALASKEVANLAP